MSLNSQVLKGDKMAWAEEAKGSTGLRAAGQDCKRKPKVLPSYMTLDKPLDLCFLGLFPALLQGIGAAT